MLRMLVSLSQSLLRQTQLRSLSKSDTKLHELYRVKDRNGGEWPLSWEGWGEPVGTGDPWRAPAVPTSPGERIPVCTPVPRCPHGLVLAASPMSPHLPAAQRPASLDFLCPTAPPATGSLHSSGVSVLLHRELPQIPIPESPVTSPAPDQTYSNLLFTPLRKLVPDTVYECLAVGGEDAPVPPMPTGTQGSCPRAGRGAADYACVHKVKKTVPAEEQDGAVAGAPAAPQCWGGTGDSPQAKVWLLGSRDGHDAGAAIAGWDNGGPQDVHVWSRV